jgi:hypothetical protein
LNVSEVGTKGTVNSDAQAHRKMSAETQKLDALTKPVGVMVVIGVFVPGIRAGINLARRWCSARKRTGLPTAGN